jgi:DNA-binding CsgD family transcriptional regulator
MALFSELNDKGGLASSLVIYATRGADYLGSVSAPVLAPLADRLRDAERALDMARAMDARPAESMAHTWLGLSLTSVGEYGRGLGYLRQGLALAEAIEHRHFMATAHMILGAFHADILAWPQAREHLTLALRLAQETGSHVWLGITTALLADTHTYEFNFTRAETMLRPLLTPALPMHTTRERHLWRAQAEWHLAQGQPAPAFDIAQRLVDTSPKALPHAAPRLSLLLAEAALVLRRYATAQTALDNAHRLAAALNQAPLLWRIHLAHSRLARAQGQSAEPHLAQAQAVIDSLTMNLAIEDAALANDFKQAAERWALSRPASARAASKHQHSGLTQREREVAALIAQGQSNKDIADALALSNRTVEAHIGHILSKLGFTSRAQIAVWAVKSEK